MARQARWIAPPSTTGGRAWPRLPRPPARTTPRMTWATCGGCGTRRAPCCRRIPRPTRWSCWPPATCTIWSTCPRTIPSATWRRARPPRRRGRAFRPRGWTRWRTPSKRTVSRPASRRAPSRRASCRTPTAWTRSARWDWRACSMWAAAWAARWPIRPIRWPRSARSTTAAIPWTTSRPSWPACRTACRPRPAAAWASSAWRRDFRAAFAAQWGGGQLR